MNKTKKWTRIEAPPIETKEQIKELCDATPGMAAYGNRVRIVIGIPVDVAAKVAQEMKRTGKSSSTIISEILTKTLTNEE
tara:strand:+ start:4864 stop:5103 length:240 start_codon:yes stop_codon:yes gene_type:complete